MRVGVVVSALAFVLSVPPSASPDENAQLFGKVGPGFTIELMDAAGKRVTNLAPGSYTFHIDDMSAGHNFHLYGPGVDEATDVVGTGETSWTLQLQPGPYVYQCDIHVGEMSGGFDVGSMPPAATTSTTTTTITPPPPVGKLLASVAGGRLSLSAHTVRGGQYRMTVRDRSRTDNFHFSGPGINRRTSILGTGTVTWSIRLTPGSYTFGSDARTHRAGRLVVR